MRTRSFSVPFFAVLFASAACNDPGSTLFVTDARVVRGPDRRLLVDVDLEAHETSGQNIGVYCVRATFSGQDHDTVSCRSDLKDGDTTTVRVVSDKELGGGTTVRVRVHVGDITIERNLVAPG